MKPGPAAVLIRFWFDDSGTTAIEYALIAGIVSLAIVVGATSIGVRLKTNYFQPVANALS